MNKEKLIIARDYLATIPPREWCTEFQADGHGRYCFIGQLGRPEAPDEVRHIPDEDGFVRGKGTFAVKTNRETKEYLGVHMTVINNRDIHPNKLDPFVEKVLKYKRIKTRVLKTLDYLIELIH